MTDRRTALPRVSRLRRGRWSLLLIGALMLGACASPIAGSATADTTAVVPTTKSPSPTCCAPPPSMNADGSPINPTRTASSTTPTLPVPSSTAGTTPGTTPTTSPASATGKSVDRAAFAAKMHAATASVRTMTGSLSVVAGSLKEQGTFRETISAGQMVAMEETISITSGGQTLPMKMLVVKGKFYLGGAKLLAELNVTGKTWAQATTTSSNAGLRSLATTLEGFADSARADQWALYAQSATSITDGGTAKLANRSTHRYEIVVDVAQLSRLMTGAARRSLEVVLDSGVKSIPSTIWVDTSGRAVQATSKVKVGGVSSDTTFRVTAYNSPVVITAPNPEDVYTG